MGLLRKLAELVVEFPEGNQPEEAGGQAGDDVVAAIEQIRLDLEQSSQAEFSEDESVAAAPAASQAAAALPAESDLARLAAQQIPLPRALSIQEIYEKAKIPAGADFDIFKVEEMLADPEIADLDVTMRARMVRMTLKNLGRELTDILADASLRDRALESYYEFLTGRTGEVAAQLQKANAGIQRELDSLVQQYKGIMESNDIKRQRIEDSLADFKRTKEVEEQRLFNIAAPFVGQDPNPVDIGEMSGDK
jgi:hypothetical protein